MNIPKIVLIVVLVFISCGGIGGCMYFWPRYRIYQQRLAGEASLREAEWEKKIAIEEAKAKKDSAVLEAQAEVERAKGVAEANKIIGNSLKGNEAYLRYLWFEGLFISQSMENAQFL